MISLNLKNKREGTTGGFTLLELLIVISIIAILSIALVFMLNPAETLKKARDAQRISDLKTVKTALGIFLTSTSTPNLQSGTTTAVCVTNNSNGTNQAGMIAYSAYPGPTTITNTTSGSDGGTTASAFNSTAGYVSSTAGKVDGNGWIPVNLKVLTSGTPISAFPVDPVNTVSTTATSTDLVYRYACQNLSTITGRPSYIFEIDARLESSAYVTEDAKMSKDGGDNDNLYESGNSLNLLPTGGTF
ncbi:MAG: prepilin-type N-terminal cleavage/methylation domain-containing protein [Candidatus Yonathbacteria bacterium]|nr:prepilin-type N-terminal cleavage/methylation domain-containing protein [Candidatus Yonathbacteria bacterium]